MPISAFTTQADTRTITPTVVIEVRDGNVVDCYTNGEDINVVLVDWDNISRGDKASEIVTTPLVNIPDDVRSEIDEYIRT